MHTADTLMLNAVGSCGGAEFWGLTCMQTSDTLVLNHRGTMQFC